MDSAAGMAALTETRFDLLREIKSGNNAIPVIAMTAYDDDDREMTSISKVLTNT